MKSKSILSTLVLIVMISYVYPTVATKQTDLHNRQQNQDRSIALKMKLLYQHINQQ